MHHTLNTSPTQHLLEALCAYGESPVLDLTEKREGPEHPYGVVDRSYANFRECPECELRLNGVLRSSGIFLFSFPYQRVGVCQWPRQTSLNRKEATADVLHQEGPRA